MTAQAQVHSLHSRVQELEGEVERKKKEKTNHLEKWDWLEGRYNVKCQEVVTVQQSVEKLEDEVRVKDELITLKDQRIDELETDLELATKCTVTEVCKVDL